MGSSEPQRASGWLTDWMPPAMRQAFAALPGVSLESAGALPGAAVQALVGAVQERLVGRHVTIEVGGTAVSATVVSVVADPGPMGLLAGQFENVRLVARDLSWEGRRLHELTVTCRNVHIRPGWVPVLVAAPVEFVAVATEEELATWLDEVPEQYELWVGEDGVARAALRRLPRVGHVQFEPRVEGSVLRFVPRRYVVRHTAIPLPLHGHTLSLHDLPHPLVIRHVETGSGRVVVEALLTEWRQPLSPGLLKRLLDRVRQGAQRIEVPEVRDAEPPADQPDETERFSEAGHPSGW